VSQDDGELLHTCVQRMSVAPLESETYLHYLYWFSRNRSNICGQSPSNTTAHKVAKLPPRMVALDSAAAVENSSLLPLGIPSTKYKTSKSAQG